MNVGGEATVPRLTGAVATHPRAWRALRAEVRTRLQRHLKPRPRLTGSEWTEQFLVLPAETTHQAGRVRLAVTPYLRDVLDAITDRSVRQVTVVAPSQCGKTTLILAVLGYYVHQQPSPILIVQPTIEMAEDFSKGRLKQTFDATPELAELIPPVRSRDSANTIRSKQFPGGQLDITGANSPAGLASRPKRIVLFDEVDRYPETAGAEGDPISIARARLTSYGRAAIEVEVSSPTDEPEQDGEGRWSGSRVWREYLAGTREIYEVSCPRCGHWQVLDFDRLLWDTSDHVLVPDSVRYPCVECSHEIRERDRFRLPGRWRATNPRAAQGHRSFHLEGLSAAFAQWDVLVREFREVKNDPVRFKTWTNTRLGRTWKDRRVEGRSQLLAQRAVPYDGQPVEAERLWQVPRGVALLTAGVDVQGDRLEIGVWGWGLGQQSWLIAHVVLLGDPTQPAVWDRLDNLRRQRWSYEGGGAITLRATAVDAGDGNMASTVYSYSTRRVSERVFAVKGHSRPDAPLTPRKPTRVRPGRLYVVGSQGLTSRWYLRLDSTTPGPGYVNLNEYATDSWLQQFLGMERITHLRSRGRRWQARKNTRVEAIDCANYALAAYLLTTRDEDVAPELERVHKLSDEAHAEAQTGAVARPKPRATQARETESSGGWLGSRRRGWR